MAEAARQAKAPAEAAVRPAERSKPTIARRALDGRRSTLLSAHTIQPSLRVSQPGDAAEQEADRVAKAVVSMPEPAPVIGSAPSAIHRAPAKAAAAAPGQGTDPAVEAEVRAAATGGRPLPAKTRAFLEPRMRASFAGVRIHTDGQAAKLANKLSASAFTFGSHVFFAGGAFDPDSRSGLELLAHELTHTIQQGETIQRKADPGAARVTQRTERQASRLGVSDVLDYFADAANAIPGYRMFTILIGVNPINMSSVEASAANILRAIVEFLPGGNIITRVLDNYGVFDKVGAWIEGQLKSLGISGSSIKAAIDKFIDSLSWKDIFRLGSVWDRAKAIFTDPITKIIAFAKSLFGEILRFVREAVLRPLAALAEGTDGYPLLKAVMGMDPVTGEPYPRTAETVIGGFMKLIGQEELWANIQRAKAIPRAWEWFQKALKSLMALVKSIPGRFIGALKSLEIMDFVVLPSAFIKLAKVFGNFLADFGGWAFGTILDLAKIIVEVVAPGVMPYVNKAAATFNTIAKDPIRFVKTLIAAAMQGFRQFTANFLTHLKASLIGWITGALGGAGVYIPQGFSLSEIVKFVLSVLGLTWANVRAKLVAATSETTVKAFETGFDLVKKLVKEGPAAAWQQIVESLTNLKEMVLEQAMSFVKSKVVEAAVTKLLSMLSPAGALIQAIIAIWNTIMFFKERLSQIAQVAASFIDSLATIASGNIGPAANKVETTMAGLLTLVISFLARIAGLGKVSDAILDIVKKIRAPIDAGLTKAVGWIVAQAKKLGKLLIDKVTGKANRTPQDIERDKQKAQRELPGKIDALLAGNPMKLRVRAQLAIWKLQYKLTDLKLTEAGEEGRFVATINPTFNLGGGVRIYVGEAELIALVNKVCDATLKKSSILKREAKQQRDDEQANQLANPGTQPVHQSRGARSTLAFANRLRTQDEIRNRRKEKGLPVAPHTTPSNPDFVMGKDAAGNDIRVRWMRRSGAGPDTNRVINQFRPYLDPQTGIANALPKGNQSAETVKALATLGQRGGGGQLAPGVSGSAAGDMSALMFGQEVARNVENVAFGGMALDLMARENIGTIQATQMLPATASGASSAQAALVEGATSGGLARKEDEIREARARGHDKRADEAATKKGRDRARAAAKKARKEDRVAGNEFAEVRRRTVELITRWIRSEVREKAPVTKTKQKFVAWVEAKIRDRVNKVIREGK